MKTLVPLSKKGQTAWPALFRIRHQPLSDTSDLAGLQTFRALRHFELNLVALGKALETFALNLRMMDKYVTAVFLRDKTKTF